MAEPPDPLGEPLVIPWLSFVNINDRDGIGDPRTPQPMTDVQTLYLVNPRNGQRVAVTSMPASTDNQVYWSPTGERVAYFRYGDTPDTTGLYVLDLTIGITSRILRIDSLSQRGFFSPPVWSPDGLQIALVGEAGYDTDIYLMNADGTNLRSVTGGGFDLWPSWSPDGQYIAFVSDRDVCPSWAPGDGCFEQYPNGPGGGHLFVLQLADGQIRRLSEEWLTEPPHWITNRWLAYATGGTTAGGTARTLWRVDINGEAAEQVSLAGAADSTLYLAESWSPDGERVIFQQAGQTTELVLMDAHGNALARTNQFNFARYAFHAAWSPDGRRLAFGGHNGQCPYGLIVLTDTLQIIANTTPPPTACDPVFSPDGSMIAFAGINPRIDGRLDLYQANANGFSAVNLSTGLQGQIRILGWVGGAP